MGEGSTFRLQGIGCGSWREETYFNKVNKHIRRVRAVLARYLLNGQLAKE